MSKQLLLPKTCLACSLQKPISAFLQISGPQGTSYGNICSTCRGSGMDKKIVIEQVDGDHSGSSTGLKIDAKTKVQIERNQHENLEHKKELDRTEAEKQLHNAEDKEERKEQKEENEKKHRENFIEPKKTESFFTKKTDSKLPLLRSTQEKQIFEKRTAVEHVAKKESLQQGEAVKQDAKDKGLDLTDLATDELIGGKVKLQTGEFNRLKSWFGNAPMNTVEHQGQGKRFLNKSADKNTTVVNSKENNKDPLVDFVKENWEPTSPGSKRR